VGLTGKRVDLTLGGRTQAFVGLLFAATMFLQKRFQILRVNPVGRALPFAKLVARQLACFDPILHGAPGDAKSLGYLVRGEELTPFPEGASCLDACHVGLSLPSLALASLDAYRKECYPILL
jgi:hypothetical protein